MPFQSSSGKRLRVERLGSLADLDARIAELQKAAPANLLSFLPLMYYCGMLRGEGKLDTPMNDRYPSIRPTTLREYVAREGL
jgi:hypothetical protein